MDFYGPVKNAQLEIVKFFIEEINENYGMESENIMKENAIILACQNVNSLEVVKYLVENELCVISQTDRQRSNALFHATQRGNLEVLKIIHPYFDMRVTNNMDRSALHIACANGWLEIVQFIVFDLDMKNDIDIPNPQGWTPFLFAALGENIELLKFLIYDMNVNIHHRTSLDWLCVTASAKQKKFKECRFLLENLDLEYTREDEIAIYKSICMASEFNLLFYLLYEKNWKLECENIRHYYCISTKRPDKDTSMLFFLIENGFAKCSTGKEHSYLKRIKDFDLKIENRIINLQNFIGVLREFWNANMRDLMVLNIVIEFCYPKGTLQKLEELRLQVDEATVEIVDRTASFWNRNW